MQGEENRDRDAAKRSISRARATLESDSPASAGGVPLSRLLGALGPRPSPPPKQGFEGCEHLSAGSAREVLARILDTDPLALAERCERHLHAHAHLVDRDRLLARTAAHVALSARGYAGTPPLDTWLAAHIERTLGEILREDLAAVRGGEPLRASEAAHFRFLVEAFGVEPAIARRAAVAFNGLPDEVRGDWWALVMHRKSLAERAAECSAAAERVETNVKRALTTIALLRDPERPASAGGFA